MRAAPPCMFQRSAHNTMKREMRDRPNRRQGLFRELEADLKTSRPEVTDIVACPLCLAEYGRASIEQLSREHIVPSRLGGRSETLTCYKCNNTQGSRFDSHLIRAMKAMDAVEGEEPIATTLGSTKGKIVAELLLGKGTPEQPNRISIIGKAGNLQAAEDLQRSLADGFTLNLHMSFQLIPERYFRAAFRAAFLSVFKAEGYRYALSVGAGQVRTMLNTDMPVLEKVVMEAFPERDPLTDLLVMPITFNDVGDCYVVLLRLQTKRTRYITVLLPGKAGVDWASLEALYEHAPRLRLETTPYGWESKLYIHLGYDPLFRVRQGMRDHFRPRLSPGSATH